MTTATCEALPCIDCGTTGGYTPPQARRPARIKGRCRGCSARRAHAARPRSDNGTGPPGPTYVPGPRELWERTALVRVAWRRKAMAGDCTALSDAELRRVLPS